MVQPSEKSDALLRSLDHGESATLAQDLEREGMWGWLFKEGHLNQSWLSFCFNWFYSINTLCFLFLWYEHTRIG